ncbi:MAG: hypothetical protein Fur002_18760 [Anaerolineales bacterium]
MKPENFSDHEVRASIARKKWSAGLWYGIFAGSLFALAGWGWDAYVLNQFHGYLPWLSLTAAILFCAAVGGLAGWLTMRLEKALLGFLFWLLAAFAFTWLTVALNFYIKPAAILALRPELAGLLNYSAAVNFSQRFWAAALFIVPLTALSGALQIQFVESSVFSPSTFGKITPFFITLVIMGLSGATADAFSNNSFRGSVIAVDSAVQVLLENQNNPNANKAELRQMRLSAFNTVKESVTPQRALLVATYDNTFGEAYVLIRFEKNWVNCLTVSEQLIVCKKIDSPP